MSFDEEALDLHGECRHEIERLTAALRERDAEIERLRLTLKAIRVAATDNPWRTLESAKFVFEVVVETATAALRERSEQEPGR